MACAALSWELNLWTFKIPHQHLALSSRKRHHRFMLNWKFPVYEKTFRKDAFDPPPTDSCTKNVHLFQCFVVISVLLHMLPNLVLAANPAPRHQGLQCYMPNIYSPHPCNHLCSHFHGLFTDRYLARLIYAASPFCIKIRFGTFRCFFFWGGGAPK